MRILVPLCLTGFVGYLNLFGLTPFVGDIADDLGISVSSVGIAITGAWLVSAAAGLFVGPVADHYGQRRTIVAGLIAIAISAVGTGIAPNFVILVATRAIGGIGASVAAGVTLAVAAERFEGDRRRRALAITSASMALAVMIGLFLLTSASTVAGWRGALVALAVGAVAALVSAIVLLPSDRKRSPGTIHPAEILTAYGPLLRARSTLRMVAATFLHGATLTGLTTYIGVLLVNQHALSTQAVGAVLSVAGAGYFVGTMIAGSGLGPLNLRGVYALTAIFSGLLWTTAFGLTGASAVVIVCIGLATFGAGLGWVCLLTLIANDAPRQLTTMMVLGASMLSFGSAFGSGLGGVILEATNYQVLGVSLASCVLVGAHLVWRR